LQLRLLKVVVPAQSEGQVAKARSDIPKALSKGNRNCNRISYNNPLCFLCSFVFSVFNEAIKRRDFSFRDND